MKVYKGEKKHNIQDFIDKEAIVYQQGFESGKVHRQSSPETLTKLTRMSEDITQLKVATGKIDTKLDGIISTLEKHLIDETEYRKTQDCFHKEIMDKKANIWVEKVIIGIGSIVGTAIIGALLGLILIKY